MVANNCSNNRCCDVCSPAVPLSVRLNVVQQTVVNRRKRRRVVRQISDVLREKLVAVRDKVYMETPAFIVWLEFNFCVPSRPLINCVRKRNSLKQ